MAVSVVWVDSESPWIELGALFQLISDSRNEGRVYPSLFPENRGTLTKPSFRSGKTNKTWLRPPDTTTGGFQINLVEIHQVFSWRGNNRREPFLRQPPLVELLPKKRTYPPKNAGWKTIFLLKWSLFSWLISIFGGVNSLEIQQVFAKVNQKDIIPLETMLLDQLDPIISCW